MSSTTGLSRTRSLRQPAVKDNESAPRKPAQSRTEARNVSPSRLPMKPPTTTSRTRPPNSLTSRQTSGGSSSKFSSRLAENGASATAKPLGRAPSVRQAPSTATRTSTTTTSTTGRSASITRPKSSGGIHPTAAPRERHHMGHSRAKSTVTSLTAATTLRPLSHVPPRSNPSPAPSTASSASTTTQTTSASSTRPQTRSQTQAQHARVASQTHSRTKSQSQSHSTTTSASASNPTLAARRPAFNTNQQHYSPAKSLAPKPLTSTFLAPPSPSKQPVNVALTAETSRLQTELLQLSLLHREAHAVSASWHASARSKLGARFREVAAADRALRTAEREGAEVTGLADLIRWGDAGPDSSAGGKGGGGSGGVVQRRKLPLDEKVQLLDQVLNGAWALGEPGGRYQRVVRAFEDWVATVAEIRAAQRGGDIEGLLARGSGSCSDFGPQNGNRERERERKGEEKEEIGIFVSDLDAGAWKRDHAGLVRMLEGWRRTLAQLGTIDDDDNDDDDGGEDRGGGDDDRGANAKGNKPRSGLARTLGGCRGLVHGMLAELKAMEQIEIDALAAEEEWMEHMEARLKADGEDDSRSRRSADVPPWKLLVL
ncbi:hypothetical protein GGR51DRAFT_519186 [Nemania sp. FL0031]|nr:hypothetical protein GGR51DRAFT_519186 [Nemania sp. FL0031]